MLTLRAFRSSLIRYPLRASQFCDDKKDKKHSKDNEKFEKKDDKPKKDKKPSTAERLNKLLTSMNTDENITLVKTVEVPKAGGRKIQRKKEETQQKQKTKSENIVEAAKEVAKEIGGDSKQTESELLSKLLHYSDTGKLEGSDDSSLNLSELIVGMKIDRETKPQKQQVPEPTRSQFVRKTIANREREMKQRGGIKQDSYKNQDRPEGREKRRREPREPVTPGSSVNLFAEEGLGIFTNVNNLKACEDLLQTWEKLYQRELKLSVTHPPSNYYEKMALWTEQGKLWKFPIDNEQGLEEESQVDFSEHVFLEQHLESWCPTKGPIRHFMELVCVGLSKNPYITAKDKKEHILWYRDFFEEKKELLQEIIIHEDASSQKPKAIEK